MPSNGDAIGGACTGPSWRRTHHSLHILRQTDAPQRLQGDERFVHRRLALLQHSLERDSPSQVMLGATYSPYLTCLLVLERAGGERGGGDSRWRGGSERGCDREEVRARTWVGGERGSGEEEVRVFTISWASGFICRVVGWSAWSALRRERAPGLGCLFSKKTPWWEKFNHMLARVCAQVYLSLILLALRVLA